VVMDSGFATSSRPGMTPEIGTGTATTPFLRE
jgi:hypothetical protein